MRSFSVGFVTLVICSLLLFGFKNCDGHVFSFKMHHRFTDTVKNRTQFAEIASPAGDWPAKGSHEYYAELARHDRFLHGRRLAEADSLVAFSDGNSTVRMSSLGFLHYATVKLGTPGMKFLVALDTGSDLFWVPCECSKCASTEGTAYASEFELSIYDPEKSSTSRRVGCNDNICTMSDNCQDTPNICPYTVSYVSDQTSSSGVLVEDVLHLMTKDEPTEAYIAFGCGQVQTGSFLNIAAPNGLFGLGMEKTSVPSILAEEGYIADSFSMCFGPDGVGRINFGDKGSSNQDETPFNPNPSSPSYNISIVQIRVGATVVDANVTALFDSGTSFTYLSGSVYTRVIESFHSQARDERHPPDSRIPFEYCYVMSSDANSSSVPSLGLIMKGGSQFSVHDPLAIISTQDEFVYCLAIVKSTEINIVGQNFMSGYRVVFDREKLVLGWKKFNCYEMEDQGSFSTAASNATLGTATDVAAGLDENRSNVHSSASFFDADCGLSVTDLFCFRYLVLVFLPLML